MRDVLTTVAEVAGLVCGGVAVAVGTGASWVAWGVAAVALVAGGVVEGRR